MDESLHDGNQRRWSAALDALPQLLMLLDDQARVIWANVASEQWGLGPPGALVGHPVHNALHRGCDGEACALADFLRRDGGPVWREGRWQDHDPRIGAVRLHGLAHGGEAAQGDGALLLVVERLDGQLASVGPQPMRLSAEPADTPQSLPIPGHRAGHPAPVAAGDEGLVALTESPALHSALVHNTLTGIYILSHGRIIFCNERFAEIFGYGREVLYGMHIKALLDEGIAEHASDPGAVAGSGMGGGDVFAGTGKDGERVWLKSSLSRLETQGGRFVLGNVIEITEQIRTQEEMRQSEEELELLSAQLISLQETERKRISAELHDSIGQHLSTIKFAVEDVLRHVGSDGAADCQARLHAVVARIRSTIEEVRRISMDLRPSILDDLGLLATIEWITREFGLLVPGVRVEKRLAVAEQEIPEELKLIIFRLLQEAFHNITKHAQASHVLVTLERLGERLRLQVRDDGRGFSPDSLQHTRDGLGLRSMQERVKFSGGTLALESEPGRGTRLSAEWTLTEVG